MTSKPTESAPDPMTSPQSAPDPDERVKKGFRIGVEAAYKVAARTAEAMTFPGASAAQRAEGKAAAAIAAAIRSLAAPAPVSAPADALCACGHPESDHPGSTDGCRKCGCDDWTRPAPSSGSRDDGLRERVEEIATGLEAKCRWLRERYPKRGSGVGANARALAYFSTATSLRRALASGGDHGSNEGRK